MPKKLLLFIMLISVLTYTGCGGGSGSGSGSGGGSTTTSYGAIQGTVSIGASSSSLSMSTQTLSSANFAGFAKTAVRQDSFATESVANERIVKLRSGLSATEAAKVIASMGGTVKKKLYGTDSTYLISVNDQTFSEATANQISNVESVGDNLKVHAFAEPNDTYFKAPYYWNYNMLNLPAAWEVQKGTDSIIVAVLDTGISKTHPDLAANLVTGYDYVSTNDADPSDTEYYDADNQYSHGTHVAGIISAVTNNGVGIAGVAWNVKIMPIRVLGSNGSGTFADIIEGINYAVANVGSGVRVINLSLGTNASPTDTGTQTFREAIDAAISAGITVVAAAGNSNGSVAFPANYDPVIAVAALDETGARASYSNYGSAIDFCAPGGNGSITMPSIQMILSTTYDKLNKKDDYVFMSGTSQAAPHISGLAALLYASGVTTPADIKTRLANNCINLGNSSYYGNGLPDAYAALSNTSAPEMADVKVFIGSSDGKYISNLQHVGASGDFNLTGLSPGTYYICAFNDNIISNNKVDTGEDFSYQQVTVVANTIIYGVSITL